MKYSRYGLSTRLSLLLEGNLVETCMGNTLHMMLTGNAVA